MSGRAVAGATVRGGAGFVRPAVTVARRAYRDAPGATALAVFAILALLRIAGAWSTAVMTASIALTPVTALLVAPEGRREAGLHGVVRPRAVLDAVLVVTGSYALVVAACAAAFGVGGHNWLSGVRGIFISLASGNRAFAVVLAVLCMGALVPLAEEVCYRGVLHHAAERVARPAGAVLLTASGWALVHLGDYGLRPFDALEIAGMLPSVALMGLALGWCRVRTGSVVPCVVAQGVANLGLTAWVFAVMP